MVYGEQNILGCGGNSVKGALGSSEAMNMGGGV